MLTATLQSLVATRHSRRYVGRHRARLFIRFWSNIPRRHAAPAAVEFDAT